MIFSQLKNVFYIIAVLRVFEPILTILEHNGYAITKFFQLFFTGSLAFYR